MVAIYARQSIDKKDSISIETQVERCRAELEGEDCALYCDRGYSGSSLQRPAFARLLEDVGRGAVHKVVIYRLDRISRSLLDFARIIELFRARGVAFVSTREKFDTDTPMGNAMLSITMVFAQLERETLQQRLRDNYYDRGRKGMYLGGKPPYGYARAAAAVEGKRTERLVPKYEEAALVREAFTLWAAGELPLGEVAARLNGRTDKKHFTAGYLSRLLRNPVYVRAGWEIHDYYAGRGVKVTNQPGEFDNRTGCYLYGRRAREGQGERCLSLALHEGLVNTDLFLAAQRRLEGRSAPPRLGTGRAGWLSGLIRCQGCGSPMTMKTSRYRGREYRYLVCSGARDGGCPHRAGVPAHRLEEAVEERLLARAASFARAPYFPPVREGEEAAGLRRQRRELALQIQNLMNTAAQTGPAALPHLEEAVARLDCRIGELDRRLEALRPPGGAVYPLSRLAGQWGDLPLEAKRSLAGLLIEGMTLERRGEEDVLHLCWAPGFAF